MVVSREPCWGALLQGIDASVCLYRRHANSRHFKEKFCKACKHSMSVPETRVRVLTDEMAFGLGNRRSVGVWSKAPHKLGQFRYRILNNTNSCFGSRLIVFETKPPRKLIFPPVDNDLVDYDGIVTLCVSKGTAVPLKHARLHIQKRQHETNEVYDSDSETPTLCKVVVPSSSVHLVDAPLLVEDFEQADEEDEEEDEEAGEEADEEADEEVAEEADEEVDEAVAEEVAREPLQPLRKSPEDVRKHRNRQSAAKSRVQKREYISSLETRVCELSAMAQALYEENLFWKSLNLVNGDATCPLVACKGFLVAN